jgi:hypothetical protein
MDYQGIAALRIQLGENLKAYSGDLTYFVYQTVLLWIAYRVTLALYNISPWHPLSRFPGPRLASMTFLYEFWYDVICIGRYTREIQKMHERYGEIIASPCDLLNSETNAASQGPIVRINPEELHCNDPEFIDEIYASGGRVRDKYQHFLNSNAGAMMYSSFGSREHELHRMRRGAINKSFSRAQIRKLEPEIHDLAQSFCDKLLAWKNTPLDMITAFSCFTSGKNQA